MAVEASHLNLFSSQFLANREMMNPIETNGNIFETQMGYGVPLSTQGLVPLYYSLVNDSLIHQKAIKSESTLTYNNLPLKRSRDSVDPIVYSPSPVQRQPHNSINEACSPFSFLGHDISLHMEHQQFDIDRLISHHMDKMRMEIEEKRKRQTRRIMEAIEERVMKKLRGKEEEIDKIEKLNWVLEEKVKSLCIENQIWRGLAHTNEATATALRSNLEQVLATAQHVKVNERNRGLGLEDEVDDAESCCGSNVDVERRTFYEAAGSGERNGGGDGEGDSGEMEEVGGRLCRNCREEESCVLLLPCRHLCLCTVCGSGLHICPVCKSPTNARLHIKMT